MSGITNWISEILTILSSKSGISVMVRREKTFYRSQMDGDPITEPESIDGKKIFYLSFRRLFIQWFFVSFIIAIYVYFVIEVSSFYELIRDVGYGNVGLGVLMITVSTRSGYREIVSRALYVLNTGAMDDIKAAKERANSFSMPLVSMVHGVIALIIYWVVSSLVYFQLNFIFIVIS